ncbi:MAG: Fic family protein [Cytophagales bacterium]|nr:Fic family protein [Cytophagales bacterium]
MWEEFTKVNDLYIKTAGAALNIDDFNHIAITAHSTQIEGSTLTLDEAKNLIDNGFSTGGKKHSHHDMVLDHHEALTFVLSAAKAKRKITPDFIKEIAAKVMHRTGIIVNSVSGNTDETKGDYRKVMVTAGKAYFMNFDKVPGSVNALAESLQERITIASTVEDIHALAFAAHYDLVNIHPFSDGNGRVSRLLMNFIQAYHNQPLTVVRAEYKIAYFEALQKSTDDRNLDAIVAFLGAQHINWLKELQVKYEAAMKQPQINKRSGSGPAFSLFFLQ